MPGMSLILEDSFFCSLSTLRKLKNMNWGQGKGVDERRLFSSSGKGSQCERKLYLFYLNPEGRMTTSGKELWRDN